MAVEEGTTQPAPLTKSEKGWSALLVVLGVALIAGVFIWFANSTDGTLKTKDTTTTEPVGENASGTKTTEAEEYSENIVLGCLTIGAVLIISGAFFGRIREIKLPLGAGVTIGELPPDKKQVVEETIQQEVNKLAPDPNKQEVVAAAAIQKTLERVRAEYWGVIPKPPEDYLRSVAQQAVQDVASKIK